jgi:hypothetical protein
MVDQKNIFKLRKKEWEMRSLNSQS